MEDIDVILGDKISPNNYANNCQGAEKDPIDFEDLFLSYVKGELPREILKNSELLFVCKTCRNIYFRIDSYIKHYDHCKIAARASKVPEKISTNKAIAKCKSSDVSTTNEAISKSKSSENVATVPDTATSERKDSPISKKANENVKNNVYSVLVSEEYKILMNVDTDTCLVCNQKLKTSDSLKHHFAVSHLGYCRYKCSLCAFKTNGVEQARNHYKDKHDGNVEITILNIDKYFLSLICQMDKDTDPLVPLSVLSPLNPLPNNENNVIQNENSYSVVFSKEDDDQLDFMNLICLVCGETFTDAYSMRQHFAVEHMGYSLFKCRFCEFKSSSKTNCFDHASKIHQKDMKAKANFKKTFWFLHCECAVVYEGNQKTRANSDLQKHSGIFEKKYLLLEPVPAIQIRDTSMPEPVIPVNERVIPVAEPVISVSERNTPVSERNNSYIVHLKDEYIDIIDSENLYCLVCQKKFIAASSLKQHLVICHLGYDRYKCKLCEFSSNFVGECRKHALVVHKQKACSARTFRNFFFTLICKTKNVRKKMISSVIKSSNESYHMDGSLSVDIPQSIQLDSLPSIMDICDDKEYSVILFDRYDDIVDLEKLLCLTCSRTFNEEYLLTRHLAVEHLGYCKYKCKLCAFKASWKIECSEHARHAHGQNTASEISFRNMFLRIQCKIEVGGTGASARRKNSEVVPKIGDSNVARADIDELVPDILAVDDLSESYYVTLEQDYPGLIDLKKIFCLACNKEFMEKCKLRQHLANFHLGHPRYKCKQCEFKGNFIGELRQHLINVHKIKCKGIRDKVDELKCLTPGVYARTRRTPSVCKKPK